MISVNPATYVITIPQADLTWISGSNYSLDTNAFRIALRDWEDGESGIYQPVTHNHNTTVILGGLEYARTLEILSPYTVTFQSVGTPYKVQLTGSNNNILDVTNLNDVSVASNNSAGLIGLTAIAATGSATKKLIEGLRPHHSGYGETFYWDPVNGDDTNTGLTPTTACATFTYIHDNLVTDWNNDVILALPGNPSGKTTTNENISITKNYVFLRGPGRAFEIRSLNDALDLINITGDGVQIEKLVLSDSVTNTKHAIWSSGDFTHIHQVIVTGCNKGIEIFGGAHCSVDNCDVQDNLGYGLKIAGVSSRVSVHESHFGDNGGTGIVIDNVGGTDIVVYAGNIIHGNAGYGIDISTGTADVVIQDGANVYGNTLGNINDNGVGTYNGAEVNNAAVADAIRTEMTPEATKITMIEKLLRNKTLTDPATGIMTVYDDDGTTPLFTTNVFENVTGTQAYRGQGIERRDRLA